MERVLDKDIGVHFYDGPDDEEGYIFTIAKEGTVFPFKGEQIKSFVEKGSNTAEFTLFEAVKADPDTDKVSQDYKKVVTIVFPLDKKVKKDTEVSFEISIDRKGKLLPKLNGIAEYGKAMQLTDVSMVDEIEELSARIHEVIKDMRCASTDNYTGWDRDPDMRDEENGNEERLQKWLVMNDEIMKGLKENQNVEEGQIRRFSFTHDIKDSSYDETNTELLLRQMDGLISRGLDHATEQKRRKLERAHAKA